LSGYVRLHRDLLSHPAFRNDAEALAFAWLFARAAWKDTRVRYKGHAVSLRRGQLAVSIRDMADALDRDKAWVERLFKRLRAETMIETAAEAGVSVVTICNYDKYQPQGDGDKAVGETVRETDARQTRDTEQRREEDKKEEDTPPTPPAGGRRGKTRLPSDWIAPAVCNLPPKARACAEQWTQASYETHAEAFGSYWHGTGKMMIDWDATWANRIVALHSQVMRDQKFGNAPTAAPIGTPSGKQWTPEERAAYLAKIETLQPRGTDPPPAANRDPTAFGTPIGQIARRIAGQA
jgi:hypothetical protein